MTNLRIKLPDVPEPGEWIENLEQQLLEYALQPDSTAGARFARSGQELLARMPRAETLEIVLPARAVRLLKVKLPRANAASLQRVLPNLLEDALLGETAACHYALLPGRHSEGEREVAVTDRHWMRVARQIARRYPARRSVCVSEALLVPAIPFIALEPSTQKNAGTAVSGFVRHAAGVLPFSSDAGRFPIELQLLRPRLEAAGSAIAIAGADAKLHQAWARESGLTLEPSDWSWRNAPAADPALSLFQGEFADNTDPAQQWQQIWRWPLALGVASALVAIAGLNLHWLKLEREADVLRARMSADFRTLLPGMSDRGEPLLMAKRQLERVHGDDTFLVLTQALALATAAGANSPAAIKRLDFRDGVLKAELAATAGATGLIQRLQSQRELEVRAEGNVVILSRRPS